jgi:hypothetical protein
MTTNSNRLLAYGAAVLVVLAGVYLLTDRPPPAPPNAATAPQPVQAATAPAAPTTPAAPVGAALPLALTKSQQVDRLAKSPSPVDAFTAYGIIRACVYSRRAETEAHANPPHPMPAPSREVCGDLTPGQVVSRLQLLERAAAAGVHGAMTAFAIEGPRARV